MEPLDALDRPAKRTWPAEGVSRVPYWVYTDAEVYRREQQRIFRGASWSYVALAAEIPRPGDFKRSTIGEVPVVVVRAADGRANVLVNRCAHRGVQFCTEAYGSTKSFMCPYHASLLHVFLVSFGLFRADMPSAVQMDASGQHAVLVSSKGEQKASEATAEMKSFRSDLTLADPRLLDPVREFPGSATVVMQTIWPNLIVQQQSNTLATRQLVTRGPGAFELHWTFFGYADDDEDMTTRRLRQANLMGPAGLVSIDDSEVLRLAQLGCRAGEGASALVEMGGRDLSDSEHIVTEAAIRAFYAHYRRVMEL